MRHGGKRIGAGRPKGKGKYGMETKPMRVPISLVQNIEKFIACKAYQLPLYSSKVPAGFPSPADDYLEGTIDLNDLLIAHPAATFLVRATGISMQGVGIGDNAILVVDKSIEPKSGKIVIAAIDGQLTVKRLHISPTGELLLMPENPQFQPIEIKEGNEVFIWGVVTNVINQF